MSRCPKRTETCSSSITGFAVTARDGSIAAEMAVASVLIGLSRLLSPSMGKLPGSYTVSEKMGKHNRVAFPDGQQAIQLQSHEAARTGNDNAVGLSVGVDQPRRRVGAKGIQIALLVGSQGSGGFQLCGQRGERGADVVIEERRKIRITIGRQLFLERLGPGQHITRLPVLYGTSDQRLAGSEDAVAVDEGVVDFKVRALVVAQGKVGHRTKLPLTEVQLAVRGRCLPVEALYQLRDGRL